MATSDDFHCTDCNITEEEINKFDQNQYYEILDLLEKHHLDPDLVDDLSGAQNLLFKHLKQKNRLQTQSAPRTDVVKQVVEDHHSRRKTLLKTTKGLQHFLRQLPGKRFKEVKSYFPDIDRQLQDTISILSDAKCSFIVAGETGSGKSCFLNLLMGHLDQNFLPVKNVPSTSCMCEVMYGEKGQISAYKENSDKPEVTETLTEENMTEMLSKFTHQKEDRDTIKYTKVVVKWPLSWLKSGLTIVDSPGVGERSEITQLVKDMMPKAFGFIYVVNTTKAGGIQTGELEDLLLGCNKEGSPDTFDPRTAIFIFNKWDCVDQKEKQAVKDAVKKKLASQVWKGIDTENQMFFFSTTQATSALKIKPEGYVTEEYSRVLKGIERLMEFSMRSKMKKHYNLISEIMGRVVFILKVYLGSYDDLSKNYQNIKSRLDRLENSSSQIQETLKKTLKNEVEHIVHTLKRHLSDAETKQRLLTWHTKDCPSEYGDAWEGLARQAKVFAYERVTEEIKRWEKDNEVMEKANANLLKVFQTNFMSLQDELKMIESDFIGNVDDKQLKGLFNEVKHDLLGTEDLSLTTTDKVVLGVTAPLWVPIGIVVGLIATPFIIGWAIRANMKEERAEAQYYTGYLTGQLGTIPELLHKETETVINGIVEGSGLNSIMEERMQSLMRKFLFLINKIPDFVAADKKLLSNMKRELEEGIGEEQRSACRELLVQVQKLQRDLDYFYILHIHENDLSPADLKLDKQIGEGAFGDVFKAQWNTKESCKTVAVKKLKVGLTPYHASELKIEHSNLKKIRCANTIEYHGLCCDEKNSQKVPMMVMEFCDTSLDKVIYDSSKYIGPGTLDTTSVTRKQWLKTMADYARQIANGLRNMHKMGMVHRDLKPANILAVKSSSSYTLKICDFGLTKEEEMINKTLCGTPLYAAPEVMGGQHYDKSTDVFSYGLILVELFYGRLLTHIECLSLDFPPTKIKGDPFGVNPPEKEWVKLMTSCWSVDSCQRPSMEACHQFFFQYLFPKPQVPPKIPPKKVKDKVKDYFKK